MAFNAIKAELQWSMVNVAQQNANKKFINLVPTVILLISRSTIEHKEPKLNVLMRLNQIRMLIDQQNQSRNCEYCNEASSLAKTIEAAKNDKLSNLN